MMFLGFVRRQIVQIAEGGVPALVHKLTLALKLAPALPLFVLALAVVVLIRLLRPILLVRVKYLLSQRIGHFAANTELHLCELEAGINAPRRRHFDIFYLIAQPCNAQLDSMWRRRLRVWPSRIMAPVDQVNRIVPGWSVHTIGNNTQDDRDVHNLWDRMPSHLTLTAKEEEGGSEQLRAMGIPPGAPFVCLIVRDSVYLEQQGSYDWTYHNYRDSNIENYVLAAEALADRGFYVIRMGQVVEARLRSRHARVIDYATNGARSDFMDVYLGAKCAFCVSTGTGWDYIPGVFRRPIAYVNFAPFGALPTFRTSTLALTKAHHLTRDHRRLTPAEIFSSGVAFSQRSSEFQSRGIQLVENTPEEIRDVAVEMAERLNGTWRAQPGDEYRQQRLWTLFQSALTTFGGQSQHGELRARFGADFLRNNPGWLRVPGV